MSEQILERNTPDAPLSDEDKFNLRQAAVRQRVKKAQERLKQDQDQELDLKAAERVLKNAIKALWQVDNERRRLYPATVSPSLVEPNNPLETNNLREIVQYLETAEVSPVERRQISLETIRDGIRRRKFAQPALRAVFGSAAEGKFFDDMLWYHMGDPTQIGHNMPKNPWVDDKLSDYYHDYSHTLVNGYIDHIEDKETNSYLIHVRETYEQGVNPLERYLVIIGNMATREVKRFNVNKIEPTPDISTQLVLTFDQLSVISGRSKFEEAETTEDLWSLNEEVIVQEAENQLQDRLMLSTQSVRFKPFGGKEMEVSPIIRAVEDRLLLARLAIAGDIADQNGYAIELPEHLKKIA